MREHERTFELFGSRVRLLVGAPASPRALAPELAAIQVEGAMRLLQRELSRFDPESELSRLNADPRATVPVSPRLAGLVATALAAAEATDGLVDPTVIGDLEAWGYQDSMRDAEAISLDAALELAPDPVPAAPNPAGRWREVSVDPAACSVTRPPGVRIDSGGSGKGLAADMAARTLSSYTSFAADCGGDVRIGGSSSVPRLVEVPDPFGRRDGPQFTLAAGGVATSGIRTRLWWRGIQPVHHLIDPSSGEPAWTGLVQATAVGATACDAETRSKAAFLSGPAGARELLAEAGGVLVHNDGEIEVVGSLAPAPSEAALAVGSTR